MEGITHVRIGGDEHRRFVGMKIQINVELAGEQALHLELAAQAALHQLPDGVAVPQIDLFATAGWTMLGFDLDGDRHHEAMVFRIKPELDALDRAHLDPKKNHRRSDLQPLGRAFKVQ